MAGPPRTGEEAEASPVRADPLEVDVTAPRMDRSADAPVDGSAGAPAKRGIPLIGLKGVVRKSGGLFFLRILGGVIVYATQVALARWMGATGLGLYVSAFSMCILLSVVADLGLISVVIRFTGEARANETPGMIRGIAQRGRQIQLASGLVVALVTCGVLAVARRDAPMEETWPFLLAALGAAAYVHIGFQSAVAQAHFRYLLAVVPNTALRPLAFLVVVALFHAAGLPLTPTVAIAIQVAIITTITVTLFPLVDRYVRRAVGDVRATYETWRWTRAALPLLVVRMVAVYLPELVLVLLALSVGASDVAIFSAAYKTALIIFYGVGAVHFVIVPNLSDMYHAGQHVEMVRLIRRTTLLNVAGAAALLVVFALFGERILGMFGEPFHAGYGALLILATSELLRPCAGPVTPLLNLAGHQDKCFVVYLCSATLVAVLMGVLVPLKGIEGAALAVLLAQIVMRLWLWLLVRRHLGINTSVFGPALVQR